MSDYISEHIKSKYSWTINDIEAVRVCNMMPYIRFPANYSVQIIPPVVMATTRFHVKRDDVDEAISVYCDVYENLGLFGGPYWEMYPYPSDDGTETNHRVALDDVDGLLKDLERAFDLRLLKSREHHAPGSNQ